MDTSKEYIEMCEKAQEIRNFYYENKDSGCFVYVKRIDSVECISSAHIKYQNDGDVWLPRQDQLQEMILQLYTPMPELNPLSQSFTSLYKFCCTISRLEDKSKTQLFSSYEQLWLAFTMQDKYNKVWDFDKKEWILIAKQS